MGIAETETSASSEIHESNNVLIVPNPSNGKIEIQNTDVPFNKYELFSIEGKLIEQGELNQSTIDFGTHSKGMFIIRLIEDSSKRYREISKRIVIE